MNAFYEHHKNNIRFHYRCVDRLLLNGTIQPFQEERRVVGFFWTYRKLYPVSRDVLRDIATQFHNWVQNRSQHWGAPIIQDPETRRDKVLDAYFKGAKEDHVVCILKAREPARILTAIGNKKENRWHLEYKKRWVDQYNFYLNDADWGRMFIRVCPYFPFPVRLCLNQHYWLAQHMRRKGIRFRQSTNAFSQCSDPAALQQLADSLTADDLQRCGQKWLPQLIPFFTPRERRWAGIDHRLFFAQTEFCEHVARNMFAIMCPRAICGVPHWRGRLAWRTACIRAHNFWDQSEDSQARSVWSSRHGGFLGCTAETDGGGSQSLRAASLARMVISA